MRRRPSSSVREVALVAAFCALGAVSGCGRETFDLLQTAGSSSVSGAASLTTAGTASGGGSSSGSAGELNPTGGRAGTLGVAGRIGFPQDGGSGNSMPCLGDAGCSPDGPSCPSSAPFCIPCKTNKDCPSEASRCDEALGRCVQCRRNSDCSVGDACDVLTQRCAKACKDNGDCVGDANHLLCRVDRGVCVTCAMSSDCVLYNPDYRCFLSACVECYENRQCLSQSCVAGRCSKMH